MVHTNGDLDMEEPNTFKILLSTDNHLGFAETDPVRKDDSFNTFEEVLQLAVSNDVDFILLGGDLFHENKPSATCLNRCINLLRKYCLGDKPVLVEYLSDQAENFRHCENRIVNYEDPNFNISIPVYSIHGNHDDPSGPDLVSALDILSGCGLINYFGKCRDLTKVEISPLLLRKGSTKLAIYGLSHIKDERLSRLFRDECVKMFRPCQDTDDWFNIFVCHQNRADHGINKYIPEGALPSFLDLVIWGHEHACRIEPEYIPSQEFSVIQPGSSVVTSLCEGEALPKYVGLLKITGKTSKLKKLPLQTVRPFVFDTIILSQCTIGNNDGNVSNNIQYYLQERIEFYIADAKKKNTNHPKQPDKPLIRVRVEYNDEAQVFNVIRFGQHYQDRIANATDMILLRKEKKTGCKKDVTSDIDKNSINELLEHENSDDMWEVKMNAIMQKYFNEQSANQLQILSIKRISEATARYIDKHDKHCIRDTINIAIEEAEKYLSTNNVDIDDIEHSIANFNPSLSQKDKLCHGQDANENRNRITKIYHGSSDESGENIKSRNENIARSRGRGAYSHSSKSNKKVQRDSSDENDFQSNIEPVIKNKAKGRGRGASLRSRGRQTNRGNKTMLNVSNVKSSNKATSRSRIVYDSDSN